MQQAGQVSYAQSKMETCCLLIYNKISILKFEICRLSLLFSIFYRLVLYEQENVYDLQILQPSFVGDAIYVLQLY